MSLLPIVLRARKCVADAETTVCRQEITITRLLLAGLSTSRADVMLVEMNEQLQIFRDRLVELETLYPGD
jgi:hypothetical protein